MKLATFQQQFFEILDQPVNHSHSFYQVCTGQHNPVKFHTYQASMQGSLFNALNKTFPACKRLVGEEFFAHLAWEYIHSHPSYSPNLNDYGQHFPAFTQTLAEVEALPYLSELAELEWHWQQLFYGPDNSQVDWQKLSKAIAKQAEKIVFKLPENCRLLKFNYAVDTLWKACQPEYQGDFSFDYSGSCYLAMFQLEQRIIIMRLSLAEWQFLRYLSGNKALELICEEMEKTKLDSPETFLAKLCQLQLIRI